MAKRYESRPESENWAHVGHVMVNCEEGNYRLPLRLDLANKSPTGFAWGYAGSGPAQLAVAMLADATSDDDWALRHYQDFKAQRIAKLPRGDWTITEEEVLVWAREAGWEPEAEPRQCRFVDQECVCDGAPKCPLRF